MAEKKAKTQKSAASGDKETLIRGAECVSKSYPCFYEDLIALGGIVYER